jgi:transaldolase
MIEQLPQPLPGIITVSVTVSVPGSSVTRISNLKKWDKMEKSNVPTGASGTIYALLADVDGTLVTKEKILTKRAIEAVRKLHDKGVAFFITSGRPPRGMRMLVEPLGLKMPMAAFNGGMIVHPDLSIVDECTLADDVVPDVINTLLAQGLDVWIYRGTEWYIRSAQAPHVDREAATVQFPPTVVPTFDGLLNHVVKIVGVSDDLDSVARCEAAAQAQLGGRVSAARSQPYYLDVTHPLANKGSVIERLSEFLKLPLESIATIGDQPNDVLMFKRSGLSIAMGNASPEVQKQANFVTTSYEDEGFANAVERFVLPRAVLLQNKSQRKGSTNMKATQLLHNLGQSLWLDNITRDLLDSGTLKQYIDELSVTGLTSNPTIFDHAIKGSSAYDAGIRAALAKGKSGEELFFDLALDDLTRAADLFRGIYDRTNGVDGWASLEVSPLFAHDTASTLTEVKQLSARAARPNLFIKIPGTKEGLPAIEEAIFSGMPINVTLLFSRAQYVAAAEAYLRGIERRIEAGLNPTVNSVASLFVSRWDVAVADKVPAALRNQLGLAVAKQTYKAYRALISSPRWERIYNAGARPQRLLWASTGTKDPSASEILYVKGLAAPFTVNTMPEKTLKALASHNELASILPADGGDCEEVLAEFAKAGVNVDALGAQLQDEGAKSFVKSWSDLMQVIESKSELLKRVA